MAHLNATSEPLFSLTFNKELFDKFKELQALKTSDYVLYGNFKVEAIKYIKRHNLFDDDSYIYLLNAIDEQIAKSTPIKTIDDYRLDHHITKTQFKFSSKEEKAIYSRFIDNWSSVNKYIYYSVVDSNMNYKTENNEYFINQSKHLTDRFNTIANFAYIVVDKQFLENNQFSNVTPEGVRYIYYVDIDDYNASTKDNFANSVMSKIHTQARVFKSYEALIEHLEERTAFKVIYVLTDKAFNGLRYMIDTIELVQSNSIETPANAIQIDFKHLNKFNCFRKFNRKEYSLKERIIEEIKSEDILFSDFIKFADKKHTQTRKAIDKTFSYNIITISRPQFPLHVYRFAKRKGNPGLRFLLIDGILIETDENFKIISMQQADSNFALHQNTDYVWMHKIKNLSINESEIDTKFKRHIVDNLQNIIQLQIRFAQ